MIQNIESENQKAEFFTISLQGGFLSGFESFYAFGKPSYERGCSKNDIFSLKERYYGPKGIFWTIGEYSIFGLLFSCIISNNRGL